MESQCSAAWWPNTQFYVSLGLQIGRRVWTSLRTGTTFEPQPTRALPVDQSEWMTSGQQRGSIPLTPHSLTPPSLSRNDSTSGASRCCVCSPLLWLRQGDSPCWTGGRWRLPHWSGTNLPAEGGACQWGTRPSSPFLPWSSRERGHARGYRGDERRSSWR